MSAPGYRLGRCPVTNKAQYTTRRVAKRVAKQFNDDSRPFRCPDCNFIHLGHLKGLTRADHWEYHAKPTDGDLRASKTFDQPTTPTTHVRRSNLSANMKESAP